MAKTASRSFRYSLTRSGRWVSEMRVSEDVVLQLESRGSSFCSSCGVLTGVMLSEYPTPTPHLPQCLPPQESL